MIFKEFEKYTPITGENAEYVKRLAEFCKDSARRPAFHLTPPCGLMNDPNGLAWYGGRYHVFYQWFPFGPSHGMKHWGHFISEDMLRWKHSPDILIPMEEYEKNGCYSGNGIQIGDELFLYYTANYKTPQGKVPKQALAVMSPDGAIRKYKNNPIIDEKPEGLTGEIRDPFVFHRNGSYYMLLGGAATKGEGRLLLYKSSDGIGWGYQGCISIPGFPFGRMIECPSLIPVDGKDVLFLSVIGLTPEGDRYHNEFSSLYLIGELDLENLTFRMEVCEELDKGFDFYAPQAFYDEDGQPVYFGWFGCGVQELPYMDKDMWIHGLTMPRILSIQNRRLVQRLPEKIAAQYKSFSLSEGSDSWRENCFHLHIPACREPVTVRLGKEGDCVRIMVEPEQGKLTLDRSGLKKQFSEKYGVTRSLSFAPGETVRLDLYYDNTFGELFVNEGAAVMSFRAFPESAAASFER